MAISIEEKIRRIREREELVAEVERLWDEFERNEKLLWSPESAEQGERRREIDEANRQRMQSLEKKIERIREIDRGL